MKRQDPILIAGAPRSGTTMLAGLLHHHGVWVGRARTTRYPDTNVQFGSENQDIKNVMKNIAHHIHYDNWDTPLPDYNCTACDYTQKRIERYVPDDVRWLVKTSWVLIFCDLWMEMYPDALWVFPTRAPQKILESMNRHPGMRRRPDKQKKRFINALQQRQSDISSRVRDYINLDVDAFIQQENNEVERLFDFLGMELDSGIVDNWIEPDRYHG